MTRETGKAILVTTFIVALAYITWDEINYTHQIPMPKRYLFACLAWAMLGIAEPIISPEVASLFGAGLVIGLVTKGVADRADSPAPSQKEPPLQTAPR